MRLLPYDSFALQTADPLPIVLARFAAQIEPEQPIRWRFSRNHLPYEGTYSESGFQIRRIIDHRNSFQPLIRGRFETSPSGTIVRITMRLHPFVVAFLGCWYLIWYGFFLPIGLTGAMPIGFALQFLGLPIIVLFAFWAAFWAEVYRSRQDLTQMVLGYPNHRSNSRKLQHWLPHALQWGIFMLGLGLMVLQITGTFHPSPSVTEESLSEASCSEYPQHSPLCKFSLVRTINGHPKATALAIGEDGQTLVSGGEDKAIKIWDLKTGKLEKTLQSDSGKVRSVAISPDGKTVVSGSADHMVRIWDLTSDQRPRVLKGHSEEVSLVSISRDGKTVISGSYGAIKQWDLATGQLKATFPKAGKFETTIGPISIIHDEAEQFNPLDINPSSNTALISNLQVVDLTSNETRSISTKQVENLFADHFLSAHVSPDGKLAVLQFGNNFRKFETSLKVWDLATGEVRAEGYGTFSTTMFDDMPLAISRNHIFGSTGRPLKIWNLQTAELEAVLNTGWMNPMVVSPDGKLLVGISNSLEADHPQIKVWQRSDLPKSAH